MVKGTGLKLQGFTMDTSGYFENYANQGLQARREWFLESVEKPARGQPMKEVFRSESVPFIGALCTDFRDLETGNFPCKLAIL